MKIYYAKIKNLSEEEVGAALQLFPKVRIEKIEKRKQEKARLQSIYAGLLLEYALQKEHLHGKNLTFLENKDGKPYIAEYLELHYNLSHSSNYVALVLDRHLVGIDVEEIRGDCRKLVKRFFSAEEKDALEAQWSDTFFTKLWTRKESYLKATGFGMRMPLEGFSTLNHRVELNDKMYDEMVEAEEIYYLDSMELEKGCWLSVCRKNESFSLEKCMPEQVDLNKFLKKVNKR